jgi:hypothetical protein
MLHCKIFKRSDDLNAIRSICVANCPALLACSLLSGRICVMLIVLVDGWDSSDGIVARHGLDSLGLKPWWRQDVSSPALRPTQPPV